MNQPRTEALTAIHPWQVWSKPTQRWNHRQLRIHTRSQDSMTLGIRLYSSLDASWSSTRLGLESPDNSAPWKTRTTKKRCQGSLFCGWFDLSGKSFRNCLMDRWNSSLASKSFSVMYTLPVFDEKRIASLRRGRLEVLVGVCFGDLPTIKAIYDKMLDWKYKKNPLLEISFDFISGRAH